MESCRKFLNIQLFLNFRTAKYIRGPIAHEYLWADDSYQYILRSSLVFGISVVLSLRYIMYISDQIPKFYIKLYFIRIAIHLPLIQLYKQLGWNNFKWESKQNCRGKGKKKKNTCNYTTKKQIWEPQSFANIVFASQISASQLVHHPVTNIKNCSSWIWSNFFKKIIKK